MSNREKIIKNYIDNNLTSNKTWYINEKYNEVKNLLDKNWYNKIFISWSLARGTSIKPINDIDIICEIDKEKRNKYKFNENRNIEYLSSLEEIFNILKEKYWEENVKLQSHSIGILFNNKNDFSIDIVPAIRLNETNSDFWDNLYEVPEILFVKHSNRKDFYKNKYNNHKNIDWKKTDPKWYINKAKQVKWINENFIYASIFLKKWKQIVKKENSKFLKSFHIEEYIKNKVISNNDFWLLDLFETIKDINLHNPNIQDRANYDINIDDYIKEDDFIKEIKNILDKINILISDIEKLKIKKEEELENFLDELFNNKLDKQENIKKPIKINKPWSDNKNININVEKLMLSNDEVDFLKKNPLK